MRDQISAELLKGSGVERFGFAETGKDDPAHREIGGADNRQQLVLLAAEPRCGGERPGDGARRRFVEPSCGRRQHLPFPYPDHHGAAAGQLGLGKADLHRVTSIIGPEKRRVVGLPAWEWVLNSREPQLTPGMREVGYA